MESKKYLLILLMIWIRSTDAQIGMDCSNGTSVNAICVDSNDCNNSGISGGLSCNGTEICCSLISGLGDTCESSGTCKISCESNETDVSTTSCTGGLQCCQPLIAEGDQCSNETNVNAICVNASQCNNDGIGNNSLPCANGNVCCSNITGLGSRCDENNAGICSVSCDSSTAVQTNAACPGSLSCCVTGLNCDCRYRILFFPRRGQCKRNSECRTGISPRRRIFRRIGRIFRRRFSRIRIFARRRCFKNNLLSCC